MPTRFRWLAAKEFRELLASRAFWLLLVMIAPLVGHAFITAVDTYAEASGIGGGPAALSQGLSPLDGILVPSFGAYDLAVTLLFPFVAIRLVAAEKASGAWKLMLQSPAERGRHAGSQGRDPAGRMDAGVDPGAGRAGALEALRRLALCAGGPQSAARASAAGDGGGGNRGGGGRDRHRRGFRRDREPGLHGGHMGAGIHRRGPRGPASETRELHAQRRAARLRAGRVPLVHGDRHARHGSRRLRAGGGVAPRGEAAAQAGGRHRRGAARLRPVCGGGQFAAQRLGFQREPPQLLLRRRRAYPGEDTPAAARDRLPLGRRPAADGPGPQHPRQAAAGAALGGRSITPRVRVRDCSRRRATIMAKSGTRSAGANP